MWIYSIWGLISVVCARKGDGAHDQPVDHDRLMLRFRLREHATAFRERFPALADFDLLATPHADYPFRLIVPKPVFAAIATELAEETEWNNFKGEAGKHADETTVGYMRCLHDVWQVTRGMQN